MLAGNITVLNTMAADLNEVKCSVAEMRHALENLKAESALLRENYGAIFNKMYSLDKSEDIPIALNAIPDSIVYHDKYPEFAFVMERYTSRNQINNLNDITRLYMFVTNINSIFENGVEGSFAELGVYKGNNAAVLYDYCENNNRKLYLLDTFEGFDEKDLVGIDSKKEKMFEDTSIEAVKEFVGESERTRYIKGYFPESATEEIGNDSFAFVSLDCDLYQPIKSGLEFFYPRMNRGGMIFIHDYSSGFFDGCKKAVDEFCRTNSLSIVLMPDKSGTAVMIK